MNIIPRRLSSLMREIIITDPSLVTSRLGLQQLTSSTRPHLFAKLKVTEDVISCLEAGQCSDIQGLQDDNYHAFGAPFMNKSDFKLVDKLISDSGMLCIVDYGKWTREDYEFDWKEFAMSTMIVGAKAQSLEEYPFIKWFCSSIDGTPEYKVYGRSSGREPIFNGLLIRQHEGSQGDSDGY